MKFSVLDLSLGVEFLHNKATVDLALEDTTK